jgi:GDP-L-fucose synthase
MKIYIAGHRGLVGSAIARRVALNNDHTWFGRTRDQLDLLNREGVFAHIRDSRPDAVVISAAKVGGIKANATFPVEFLSENLRIQSNLMDACHEYNIENVVFLGSSCIYPKFCPQPIDEEYLLTGLLETTNEAYAIAKIAGLKLVQAYRNEYGRNWISLMPTNLYGPGDNFDPETSHVLPALMNKLHEAKIRGKHSVTLWGSGSPRREFLHADDLADAVIFMLENYDHPLALNIGTGVDIEIRQLAALIAGVIGYKGEIFWDLTKPDGTPQKLLDVSRATRIGWKSSIELEDGIRSTYRWFLENFES